MQFFDGGVRPFLSFHRDKTKPARAAREFINDHLSLEHAAVGGKEILKLVFGGGKGEVSYEQSSTHFDFAFSGPFASAIPDHRGCQLITLTDAN